MVERLKSEVEQLTRRLDQIRHEVTEWERRRDTAKAEAQQADSDLSAARKLHNEISQRQGDLLRESTRLEGRIEQLKKEKEALEKNLGTLESQQPKPLMGGQ
jgi:chaperonin cofactor prefoldin